MTQPGTFGFTEVTSSTQDEQEDLFKQVKTNKSMFLCMKVKKNIVSQTIQSVSKWVLYLHIHLQSSLRNVNARTFRKPLVREDCYL